MPGKTHRIGPNLIETTKAFSSEENCHAYLEAARWPKGVRCLKCDGEKVSKFTVKGKTRTNKHGIAVTGPSRFMYQCLNKECKYQFQTTTGTIFSDTHLPLSKWMLAVALMCNAKKSVSAKQMERDMGVSYKTAWYLNHRIREAMKEGFEGLFEGTVEIDATYVGGRFDKRRKRARYDKQAVAGILQRGDENQPSQVRAAIVPIESKLPMWTMIRDNVQLDSQIYSDEHRSYTGLSAAGLKHDIVRHTTNEWVRGSVHTQGVEGFWSLLKRAIIGSFHQVSVKHLDRYISEAQFKFNNRREQEIFALVVTGLVIKGALRYKYLTGPTDAELEAASQEPASDEPF